MSTYPFGDVNGPADHGDGGRRRSTYVAPDLETLMDVADQLTETLRTEYPQLLSCGEIIQGELAQSADDGLPPNRGRIRSALETIAIAASAGTGSLAFTRQLTTAFGL
ncbi:hypothetical protein GT045_20080 [Streptomyces sp. SID486]|uniref:hypothetical protein n=1 Tax=Streptomyces sp. SID486 TaxID=2690264 RepID=UPI001370B021|nr:hypothetical protein [Streptomyces sp. SID486]MYX97053.1 hypothetical protein [Streptomyces sp. SID486]